jgi:hypothetical protein
MRARLSASVHSLYAQSAFCARRERDQRGLNNLRGGDASFQVWCRLLGTLTPAGICLRSSASQFALPCPPFAPVRNCDQNCGSAGYVASRSTPTTEPGGNVAGFASSLWIGLCSASIPASVGALGAETARVADLRSHSCVQARVATPIINQHQRHRLRVGLLRDAVALDPRGRTSRGRTNQPLTSRVAAVGIVPRTKSPSSHSLTQVP